jgi:hypothetical protein
LGSDVDVTLLMILLFRVYVFSALHGAHFFSLQLKFTIILQIERQAPLHLRMISTKHIQDSSSSPMAPNPTPPSVSIVHDMPDYWDCQPESYRGSEPRPIMSHCIHRGGIHVSWLHYCTLWLVLSSMSFVLTLWTAVALHRMEPMLGAVNNCAQPLLSPQLDTGDSIRPAFDFKPDIVIEKAYTQYITTTVEVFETMTLEEFAAPTLISSTATAPTSLSLSSAVYIASSSDTVASTPTRSEITALTAMTSSEVAPPPAATTSVTTELSVSTFTSSAKRVRPTTRYFG